MSELGEVKTPRGELQCPKKGLMSLGRCFEFQKETSSAGSPCTCDVFRGHPNAGELPQIIPAENLCGRVFDAELERTQRTVARPRAEWITPRKPERQVKQAAPAPAQVSNRLAAIAAAANKARPLSAQVLSTVKAKVITPIAKILEDKEVPVPKVAKRCEQCKAPAPEGTHMSKGRCIACRDKDKQQKGAKTLEAVAEKHTAKTRQRMIPLVAEEEIAKLNAQLTRERARVDELSKLESRVKWITEGLEAGHVQPSELKSLLAQKR